MARWAFMRRGHALDQTAHAHILIWPRRPDYEIASILKSIKQPVAVTAIKHLGQHSPEWLSRITVKKGDKLHRRFWQPGGGFDRNVTDPRLILLMIEYIHANPVRRKLAETGGLEMVQRRLDRREELVAAGPHRPRRVDGLLRRRGVKGPR
jgi:hypothetical protein